MEMLEEEIWKDVLGYEGSYQVSNMNRAKSLLFNKEKILKPVKNKQGYSLITLSKNKRQKSFYLHILVWEAFNGPVPEGFEINHIDENPSNATLSNLNLMTHKENIRYGTAQERRKKIRGGIYGCFNRQPKKIGQFDLSGNKLIETYQSVNSAAKAIKGDKKYATVISRCARGGNKTAYGFKWKYL